MNQSVFALRWHGRPLIETAEFKESLDTFFAKVAYTKKLSVTQKHSMF